jgi:hypothetical protein
MVVPEHNNARVPADVRAEAEQQHTGQEEVGDGLDGLTKDELLAEVERREREDDVDLGVKTSDTKAEILAALRG